MVSVYDFISLFCCFDDWFSYFVLYFQEYESDGFVSSITEEAAKRMRVVSCKVDGDFVRCIIDD